MKYLGHIRPHKINKSHPVRGAWIEMVLLEQLAIDLESHPVRGAWIEMPCSHCSITSATVAPRQGCVD